MQLEPLEPFPGSHKKWLCQCLNGPIFIRTFGWGSSLLDRDETTGIHKFQPVTGILAADISDDEALQIVRSLALDVMNQGGSSELGKVYLKKEI